MKELMLCVVLLVTAYGMVDLIERLVWWLLFAKTRPLYCIVPIRKGCEAEFLAFKAVSKRNRMSHGTEWILLDCGLDKEGEALVRRLCEQLKLRYCDRANFDELLSGGLQEWESVV